MTATLILRWSGTTSEVSKTVATSMFSVCKVTVMIYYVIGPYLPLKAKPHHQVLAYSNVARYGFTLTGRSRIPVAELREWARSCSKSLPYLSFPAEALQKKTKKTAVVSIAPSVDSSPVAGSATSALFSVATCEFTANVAPPPSLLFSTPTHQQQGKKRPRESNRRQRPGAMHDYVYGAKVGAEQLSRSASTSSATVSDDLGRKRKRSRATSQRSRQLDRLLLQSLEEKREVTSRRQVSIA